MMNKAMAYKGANATVDDKYSKAGNQRFLY